MKEPSGVSVLATEAVRKCERAGWSARHEDHAVVLVSGRLVREMPYSDSLGSLVYRDDMELMVLIGNQRHK